MKTSGLPADHSVMRGLNRSLVLDVLRREGPISRADLAKRTTLTKPTVSAIVDDLISSDLAVERGTGTSQKSGGRRPILVEFNRQSQYFLGIQVGETRTEVVLTDATGAEISARDRPTIPDADALIAGVLDDIKELMTAAKAPKRRLRAVGVCVPGLVDEADGVCLLAPNIGWRDVPVAEILTSALDVPTLVRNQAQAAVLAEATEGAGRDSHIIVYLYAGTGVGAGIIVDGDPFRGATGVAGEIGHCRVASSTAQCTCGKNGCLETVASERAVVGAAFPKRRGAHGSDLAAVVAAAGDGDRHATAALHRAATELGTAAATLVNLFGPNVLVVGGKLLETAPVFEDFHRSLASDVLAPLLGDLVIRTSELGFRGGLRGAVLVAQQRAAHADRLLIAPQPIFG